jgi:hypothetical protein
MVDLLLEEVESEPCPPVSPLTEKQKSTLGGSNSANAFEFGWDIDSMAEG